MMQITRIIIPVGQGAFYMENIKTNAREYNVIYDCGSIQLAVLRKCIKSDIPQGLHFDIFFISHFDYDHVNGIADLIAHGCTFGTVIVPLIDKYNYWNYIATQKNITSSKFIKNLIDDPNRIFNDTARIVKVKIATSEYRESDEVTYLDELGSEIASGTRICFSKNHAKWCYAPFNFDEEKRRSLLLNELKSKGLDATQLDKVDYINKNRKDIKAAYENVEKDGSNKMSLIVYSGPIGEYDANIKIYRVLGCSNCCCAHSFRERHCFWPRHAGCLYLGDTDLNQISATRSAIIDDLQTHLGCLSNSIGLLQIPHHGSRLSYNDRILRIISPTPYCFVSYGSNTYGHPSLHVVADILNDSALHCVTEDRNTALIQIIRYNRQK